MLVYFSLSQSTHSTPDRGDPLCWVVILYCRQGVVVVYDAYGNKHKFVPNSGKYSCTRRSTNGENCLRRAGHRSQAMEKVLEDLPWRRLHEHPELKDQVAAATTLSTLDLKNIDCKVMGQLPDALCKENKACLRQGDSGSSGSCGSVAECNAVKEKFNYYLGFPLKLH